MMLFAHLVALSLVTLTMFAAAANALPVPNAPLALSVSRRTVYNPQIIIPAARDVWKVGSYVEVTWFVLFYLLLFSDSMSSL
jgi:hypothetical protein